MKKVLALALALMLAMSLVAVAIAADAPIEGTHTYAPGSKIALDSQNFTQTTEGDAVPMKDLTKDNYTVTAKWTKGGALVDTVKFDKEDGLVIVLKENYTIDEAKIVEGTITLKAKTADKTAYDFKISGNDAYYVTNKVVEVQGTSRKDDADSYPATEDNTIYIADEDEPGYVKFNSDSDLLTATLKMGREEKVFMHLSEDMIDDIGVKYGDDDDAEIYCYSFEGNPSLKNPATLTLQGDYGTQFHIYEYSNEKLKKIDAKFNKEDGVYEWTTSKLGNYVISDKQLKVDAVSDDEEDEEKKDDEKNPNTGANDVVGVAAALAVVSLIAAGAVVLKK